MQIVLFQLDQDFALLDLFANFGVDFLDLRGEISDLIKKKKCHVVIESNLSDSDLPFRFDWPQVYSAFS